MQTQTRKKCPCDDKLLWKVTKPPLSNKSCDKGQINLVEKGEILKTDNRDSRTFKYFLWKYSKQGIQGVQAFTFCVVNVNNEHTKPRFKRKIEVKSKDDICAKLCLKLWFESEWYFCNVTESEWFRTIIF